ncbi:hypothetical protein DFH05DRAFT_1503649 [Lentinula detonsa]|uniref:AN1-type domain-containing protein n=1 Tax=Lentinula detonsa TaxID=2804962 RepID=A0A9W8TVQ4_9AGAR|nr:hypothetical protein DFH05DRAFT_1503649 [Lentinula detonsa]KAJ3990072.1 hypothetical protein F5890DRAFT_1482926 [Lentinula detonsa]
MSELLNVGNCCFLCSQIDFLPTLCPFCHNQFCKNHIQHEAHSCSAANRTDPVESFTKLQRCTLDGCKNPSLNASRSSSIPTCKACQGSFCVEHREPASHRCSPKQGAPEPTRNETARALLAKNFTSNPSSKLPVKRRIPAKPIDPARLAQLRKLELMKLRQLASPLDSKLQKTTIPVDQRRFFKASMDSKPTRDLWVEKNVITGKAFDLLAAQFGIPNAEMDVSTKITIVSSAL